MIESYILQINISLKHTIEISIIQPVLHFENLIKSNKSAFAIPFYEP